MKSMPVSTLLVFTSALLLLGPTDAYFNRMINCRQLCEMLEQSRIHQLWCIVETCRQPRLGRTVLRYSKRTPHDITSSELSSDVRRQRYPSEFLEKRDKEYWDGPAPADFNQ